MQPIEPCAKQPRSSLALTLSLLALLILAAACVNAQADVSPLEQRTHRLNKTIMCPVCPGESIDQSQNTLSVQMRAIVSEKLASGWTDDEVRAFFVERYGPSVLLEPPTRGISLTAWIVPPIGVAVALAAFLLALRHMRRPAPITQATAPDEVQHPHTDDPDLEPYYARVEASLSSTPQPPEEPQQQP